MKRSILFLLTLAFSAACASTPTVDMDEPRRIVGTENNVRVDAEVFGEKLTGSSTIAIKYDITNQRATTIAVADVVSVSTYDPETQTVTVNVGSEVQGNELVPRMIAIAPGEKKSFSTAAHVRLAVPSSSASPWTSVPRALRIKVNFLGGDLTDFSRLLTMTEKAVADRRLADELFPKWIEMNEAVYTNSIPMRWGGMTEPPPGGSAARRRI